MDPGDFQEAVVSRFSKQSAAGLAQFIDYAYTMCAKTVPGGSPPLPPVPDNFPPDYEIVAYAQAEDDFCGYVYPQFYGYVAYSSALAQVIVAIRGTADITEWQIDLEAELVPFRTPDILGAGNVEYGFLSVFQTLHFIGCDRKAFHLQQYLEGLLQSAPETWIAMAGHSLGGPIVSMLALQCSYSSPQLKQQTTVYTFASPAPGDAAFAEFYNQNAPASVRLWNRLDVVPYLPSAALGFTQSGGNGIELRPTVAQMEQYDFLSMDCNHSLQTYQWLLDSQLSPLSSCLWPDAVAVPERIGGRADRSARLRRAVEAVQQRRNME